MDTGYRAVEGIAQDIDSDGSEGAQETYTNGRKVGYKNGLVRALQVARATIKTYEKGGENPALATLEAFLEMELGKAWDQLR